MNKNILWVVGIVVVGVVGALLSGLVGDLNTTKLFQKTSSPVVLVVSGSGSALDLLPPLFEAFEEKNPHVSFKILPSTGTTDGVVGVYRELLDIGAAARPLKETEKSEYPGLIEKSLFEDALALGLNTSVDVSDLTSEQIMAIYSGEVANWSDLGGKALPIVALDREESDSSKILLREKVIGEDLVVTSNVIELHSAAAMNERIIATEGAIGHASVGVVSIKGLAINIPSFNGVMPTAENVESGKYPLVRTYGIIYNPNNKKQELLDFIDFAESKEGEQIIKENGLVPLSKL